MKIKPSVKLTREEIEFFKNKEILTLLKRRVSKSFIIKIIYPIKN